MAARGQRPARRHEPLVLRLARWSSALAMIVIAVSACRIYGETDVGGALAAPRQWLLAAIWLLAQNALVYALYEVFSGRLRRGLELSRAFRREVA